jgi:2-polyprenyl-6-methoxyphenol hydroxylase-like FAD-dependent oxidoreductase
MSSNSRDLESFITCRQDGARAFAEGDGTRLRRRSISSITAILRDTSVLIVEAGPTGLALACDLLSRGVDAVVLDRLEGPATAMRAVGLQPRGRQILERLGALGDVTNEAAPHSHLDVSADVRSVRTVNEDAFRSPDEESLVWVPQTTIERRLRERLEELGGEIRWGHDVIGARADARGVEVTVRTVDGERALRADWLVGCDGAHNVVRGLIGAPFDGGSIPDIFLNRRRESTFRQGRILIAGDAAHPTSPLGRRGVNTGLDDAFNLGWKLAMVVSRRADEYLLDSYEAERRPARERIERATTRWANWLLGERRTQLISRRCPELRAMRSRVIPGWLTRGRKALQSSYSRGPLTPSVRSALLARVIEGGPQAGDECPDAPCVRSHDSKRTSLRREVGANWGLIFFGGPEEATQACVDVARSRLGSSTLRVLRVAVGNHAHWWWDHDDDVEDDQGAIVRACRPGKATAILLRPDGHLAWRSREPDFLALTSWLDGTLCAKTRGSNRPERAEEQEVGGWTPTSDARLSA